MSITLNTEPLDITFESEQTIGEVLGLIELECQKNKSTIVAVSVDNRQLSAEELDALFKKPFDSSMSIALTSMAGEEILSRLSDLGHNLQDDALALERIPEQLYENSHAVTFSSLQGFSSNLQTLYRYLAFSDIIDLPQDFNIGGETFEAFQQDITTLLENLVGALEQNDTVLASDIAEYELAPLVKELANALLLLENL